MAERAVKGMVKEEGGARKKVLSGGQKPRGEKTD